MKRAVRWLSVFASASVMFGAAAAPAWAGTAGTAGTSGNGDFPTFGYDYQQTRHVPYTSINRNNVANLGLVWDADLMKLDSGVPGGSENFPIEVNGVLYVTTSFDHVFAFNAATGKLLWHWKPANIGAFKNFGLNVNRGVAYGDGKLFLLTLDMHLVSIDAKTGKTVKNILLSDVVPGATTANGYYETTAPIYYKGNVYVGSSGGDNGIRGFFMAFKASDLSPAWSQPFWTIPPKGQGWLKGGKFQGGGAVWMPAAIDPDTGILYFGVGNPAPDFYGKDRPGANKYTDSVVALDAKTGKLIWARQEVSHDLWDYDAASSPMVLTATVHGKKEKVVVEGGKDGQWYAWDAKTGKVIYNGVPFVTIKHPAPTPQGVLEYPGALGGENYAPETYDPGSNYALIPGVEDPMLIIAAKNDADVAKNNQTPGAVDFGTTMGNPPGNITPSGTITAIDLNTGKKVYQIKTDTPMRGGFTSTASGIAFYGDGYGYLNAMDVKTGQILWSFQTGAPIGSAPAIYQIGGKEYVAISVGGAPTGSNSNASKVEVFALGGSHAQFPPPGSVTSANGHGSTSQSGSSSAGASSFAATKGHWLALDKQSKTVDLLLIAGYNGALGGMNFNGYGNGQMKVTVPLGWKVNVKLENASGQMPHSAMIVPLSTKGTVSNFKVAFPNATTPDPLQGLAPNGQPQSFSFTANKAGTFLIWCGVPGHGVAGMYDTLVVDAKATAPSITLPGKGTTVLK